MSLPTPLSSEDQASNAKRVHLNTPAEDEPLFPIREVSRLTGIHTVTLRAWERRYGLICPHRTPKGHRLYSQQDIDKILLILEWVNRGVPISQVGELLQHPQEPLAEAPPCAGDLTLEPPQERLKTWRQRLNQGIRHLKLAQLESVYWQTLTEYGVLPAWQHLWEPCLKQLQAERPQEFTTQAQLQVLETFLRARINQTLYASQTSVWQTESQRLKLLLVRAPGSTSWFEYGFLCLQAAHLGCEVHWLDQAIDINEVGFIGQTFGVYLVLIHTDHHLTQHVKRQLVRLQQQSALTFALSGTLGIEINQAWLMQEGMHFLPLQAFSLGGLPSWFPHLS